ncbi:MAG: hypothetical protein QNJ40_01645 [Xanthomonadales bacterium]|nr:hypothetical protein [Xanthomonadales bacterium]
MTPGARIAATACSITLALACLGLAYQEGNLSLSRTAFLQWQSSLEPADLARFQRRIGRAGTGINPEATLLDARARMMLAEGVTPSEAEPIRSQLLEELEDLAGQRPTDYQPWVLMARLLLRQGRLPSDGFDTALRRALGLGPNQSRTFAELFPELWLSWYLLDPEQRQLAGDYAVRTAWREPRWAMDTALRYGFLDPMCDQSAGNRLALDHCRRLGWTPIDSTP